MFKTAWHSVSACYYLRVPMYILWTGTAVSLITHLPLLTVTTQCQKTGILRSIKSFKIIKYSSTRLGAILPVVAVLPTKKTHTRHPFQIQATHLKYSTYTVSYNSIDFFFGKIKHTYLYGLICFSPPKGIISYLVQPSVAKYVGLTDCVPIK